MTNETQANAIRYAMMLMSREAGALQESLGSEGLSEAGRTNLLNDIDRIATYRDELRKLVTAHPEPK